MYSIVPKTKTMWRSRESPHRAPQQLRNGPLLRESPPRGWNSGRELKESTFIREPVMHSFRANRKQKSRDTRVQKTCERVRKHRPQGFRADERRTLKRSDWESFEFDLVLVRSVGAEHLSGILKFLNKIFYACRPRVDKKEAIPNSWNFRLH